MSDFSSDFWALYVALMTDTDDTGERAVAFYDALTIGPAR